MKKIIRLIKDNWNDSVWSGVISGIILGLITFISTLIYILIQFLFSKISFRNSFESILDFFKTEHKISNWLITIFILIYFSLITKPLLIFVKDLFKKIFKDSKKRKLEKELPNATEHSTVLFSSRMSSAFPGIRELTWFNDPVDATKRLNILLRKPIRFKSSIRECESDPIWWFRGSSALFVDKFKKIGRKKVLMNGEQLKIKRIAAYHGKSYFKDFLYVEAEGEKQTGLYNYSKDDLINHKKIIGYSFEEYGLLKNLFGFKRKIKRQDYDDGATVIRGKVIDASNAELRTRYLTDYNFIITAKGSPYNSRKFSFNTQEIFDGMLEKETEPKVLFDFLETFTKNEH